MNNYDYTVKEVSYAFVRQNLQLLINLTTDSFKSNHKITCNAYKRTEEKYRENFIDLLNKYTVDTIEQCQKNDGMFFVAEANEKIVGLSIGYPYERKGLSDDYINSVFQSQCCFKDVMKSWWDLMGKYEGTPPGKIFHQGTMVIAREYAGKGIGAKLCALTARRIIEKGYDGYAVETSSESADLLAEKMKHSFSVIDLESNGAGLTFRLHLRPNALSEQIHQWFLEKKGVLAVAKEIKVQEISNVGVHYNVGNIAVWDSNPDSKLPVLIMLHPNSTSRLFFKKQMEDKMLVNKFRLIAIDLPGHGDSKPADNPKTTYTFPGYAQEIVRVVEYLRIAECVILGWSLGGNVALEAMNKIKGVRGVVLTGAPPVEVSLAGFSQAFKEVPTEMMKLMGKRYFTREEAIAFIRGVGKEEWMVEYGLKADGCARERLAEWVAQGAGGDQRRLVAETQLPIALIAGNRDPASPRHYLESLQFGNLWGMRYIPDSDHSVVYEKAEAYDIILLEFLNDVFR